MSESERGSRGLGRPIRELAAATGVILGLVFVGIEIRANTSAIQGSTLQGLSDQSTNLQMEFATDPDLVRLMPQVIGLGILPSALNQEDQYRVLVAYLSIIRVAENRFQQAMLRTVPGDGPDQFGQTSVLYSTPYLKALWPTIRGNFAPEFLEYFEAGNGLDPSAPTGGAALIAHRGASAYAPEHTVAAYELAIAQGADFIEPDLQITKDGVLVAIHDLTLERTTDVRERFPDRYREWPVADSTRRVWPVADFTLEEVKSLDAGSWFSEEFVGARVPTFREVIDIARGRAGIYPETKAPSTYSELGLAMEPLVLRELAAQGIDRAGADPETPVVIQSFSEESLMLFREEHRSDLPLTFLLRRRGSEDWVTDEGLARVREFADGIGPDRILLERDSTLVARAHAVGLTVTPYTFGTSDEVTPAALREAMEVAVCELGVDGLFTNNPDLFPRRQECRD